MPRFFFEIDDGPRPFRDEEGSEHADCESARQELMGALAEIAKNEIPKRDAGKICGVVKDESGRRIFEATISLQSRWIDGPLALRFGPLV